MNREIKFRAWEKNLKEMIPVYDIQFHDPREIVDGISMKPREIQPTMINTNSAWRTLKEVELMQYTGLLDKNGKEIYEGDIVNLSSWEPSVYLVAWDRGAFYMAKKNLEEVGDIKYVEKGEIIGNIYENPELLESKGKE